jgi:hypothetical protein
MRRVVRVILMGAWALTWLTFPLGEGQQYDCCKCVTSNAGGTADSGTRSACECGGGPCFWADCSATVRVWIQTSPGVVTLFTCGPGGNPDTLGCTACGSLWGPSNTETDSCSPSGITCPCDGSGNA